MPRVRTLFDGSPAAGADPYARLLDLIVRGAFAPGSRLTEPVVAEALNVSRTPAREAMQRLLLEGLLVPDGGGARPRLAVAPLDPVEAREVYRLTGMLESTAARDLAFRTSAVRADVASALRDEDAAFRAEAARPRPHPGVLFVRHHGFHTQLIGRTASPVVRALLATLWPRLARYEWFHGPLVQRAGQTFSATYAEHDDIVAAVRHASADEIERAVRTNWEHAAERLVHAIGAHAAQRE